MIILPCKRLFGVTAATGNCTPFLLVAAGFIRAALPWEFFRGNLWSASATWKELWPCVQNKKVPACMHSRQPPALLYFPSTVATRCVGTTRGPAAVGGWGWLPAGDPVLPGPPGSLSPRLVLHPEVPQPDEVQSRGRVVQNYFVPWIQRHPSVHRHDARPATGQVLEKGPGSAALSSWIPLLYLWERWNPGKRGSLVNFALLWSNQWLSLSEPLLREEDTGIPALLLRFNPFCIRT